MCRKYATPKPKVYVVVIKDTRFGVEAEVFDDSTSAVDYARNHAKNYAYLPEDVEEQDIDGLVCYIRYHPESVVFVVEKEMK